MIDGWKGGLERWVRFRGLRYVFIVVGVVRGVFVRFGVEVLYVVD